MNRGFLYGDGFFETIRTVEGRIPLLHYHLQRIEDAISLYELVATEEISEEWLTKLIDPEKNSNHKVRINFYRDGGGLYTPINNNMVYDVNAVAFDQEFWLPTDLDLLGELKKAPQDLSKILVYDLPRPIHPLYTVKSLSSAHLVLASKYKVEMQADALVLIDDKGNMLEEVTSNLLFEKDGTLYAPPRDSGCVFGACLRHIMHLYGFQITETELHADTIGDYDAIYSCKSTTGIRRIA